MDILSESQVKTTILDLVNSDSLIDRSLPMVSIDLTIV